MIFTNIKMFVHDKCQKRSSFGYTKIIRARLSKRRCEIPWYKSYMPFANIILLRLQHVTYRYIKVEHLI
jgi:hypothetical protein